MIPATNFAPPVAVNPEICRSIDGLDASLEFEAIVIRSIENVQHDSGSCELLEEMASQAKARRNRHPLTVAQAKRGWRGHGPGNKPQLLRTPSMSYHLIWFESSYFIAAFLS